MIFARHLRQPLKLLRLDPLERHVTYNIDVLHRDTRIGHRAKYADQDRDARGSKSQRTNRVIVRNQGRHQKPRPISSAHLTIFDMPSEASPLLEKGTL